MTAMNYLKKAFQIDPQNSMVLNHLANHFFFKNDLEKVQTLASNAFKNTKISEIKGEAFYYLGRLYHHQQMFDQAFNYYNQVTSQYWPDFSLGHFTLGQMYIQRNEIDKAITEFLKVAKSYPENFETQKVDVRRSIFSTLLRLVCSYWSRGKEQEEEQQKEQHQKPSEVNERIKTDLKTFFKFCRNSMPEFLDLIKKYEALFL